jgi:hypothetical protein
MNFSKLGEISIYASYEIEVMFDRYEPKLNFHNTY